MAEGREDLHCVASDSDHDHSSSASSPGIPKKRLKIATLAEGNRVDQTFVCSPVKVFAGDQNIFNETLNVYNETCPTNADINYEKLVLTVNNRTKENTTVSILDDYRPEQLNEPSLVAHPKMRRVDFADYFKGRHAVNRTSDPAIYEGSRVKYSRNQLTEEAGFYGQDENRGSVIKFDDLIASISNRKRSELSNAVDVTCIIASAGSGKTTLTRRLAQAALGIPLAKSDVNPTQSIKFKMVRCIELKDIEKGYMTLSKFLFRGLFRKKSDIDSTFEWLVNHQSEVLLILDGLDQAGWDFDDSELRKMDLYSKADPPTIIYNILARNVLRSTRIVVTSREFKVSELPAKSRPRDIITLTGLALKDAQSLFTFLVGENGAHLWNNIRNMSPRLLNLITVPVFLILTAIVMGSDPENPLPATVTELYSRIVLSFRSMENIRNRRQISAIIKKLKGMAFQGMKERRVIFYESDLKNFGVSTKEVHDLMTKVPGTNLLSSHLMEGDFTFFFCHQSMQEFLAASYIAEMNFTEFYDFNNRELHEERWSVVRKFVTGVLYLTSIPEGQVFIKDQSDKREIFAASIRSQIEKTQDEFNNRYNRMELYSAIYESNCDDDLMKGLSVINASNVPLRRDEAHIVGTLAARSKGANGLVGFNFCNCNMNDEMMNIITESLRPLGQTQVQVGNVDLRQNSLSATALRPLLGYHRNDSKWGYFDWKSVEVRVKSHNCGITVKNEVKSINIDGNSRGRFDKERADLVFEKIHMLDVVVFFGQLFQPKLVKICCDQQLYATPPDLRETSEIELRKMNRILLDCVKEENIEWPCIKMTAERYQLKQLDVAVAGQTYGDDKIPALGIPVNVHRMFKAKNAGDFKNILDASRQKKVGFLRCILEYRASLDDIRLLIGNCDLQRLTLVYEKSEYRHQDLDNTGINIIKHYKRDFDIWWYLDSGLMNKRSGHHHHHHQHQHQYDKHSHTDTHHHGV